MARARQTEGTCECRGERYSENVERRGVELPAQGRRGLWATKLPPTFRRSPPLALARIVRRTAALQQYRIPQATQLQARPFQVAGWGQIARGREQMGGTDVCALEGLVLTSREGKPVDPVGTSSAKLEPNYESCTCHCEPQRREGRERSAIRVRSLPLVKLSDRCGGVLVYPAV